jgi:TatD DNase family protein
MTLTDFHCHLDLYPEHESAFEKCERQRLHTVAVTTTPRAWPHNRDLAAATRFVYPALGLHPQLVAQRSDEVQLWEAYLPEARFVGEVGLDAGPRFYRSMDLQRQVFQRVLKLCATAGDKILTVHSTRAVSAVLDLIEEHLPPSSRRIVLHWFTGTLAEALRATSLGCYFSINAIMFQNPAHQAVVRALPIDRLLTESDGPFCKWQGRTVCPRDVSSTIKLIAKIKGRHQEDIAHAIVSTFRSIQL